MLTGLARVIFLLGCLSFALFAQVNATWSGSGNWSNPSNWSWDNSECNNFAPGMSTQGVGSTCYTANVSIPSGTVNVDMAFTSVVNNFTLASANLYGNVNPEGTAMIGSDGYVSGGVFAAGTLTNQGTIVGGASGGPLNNSGTIKITGGVTTYSQGSNAGIIEATASASFGGTTGFSGLSGVWDNTKGIVQIDSGATLLADGTITGGALNDNGGVLVGSPLILAGVVNSNNSLTIDAPSDTSNVMVNGTLNINGSFTLGQNHGVSTMKVNAGGVLAVSSDGQTILGANSGATGQLEFLGASAQASSTGMNLTIGALGTGYVSVVSGATLNSGNLSIGSGPTGSGHLDVPGGVVNYQVLDAARASMFYGPAITVNLGGHLVGAIGQESPPLSMTEGRAAGADTASADIQISGTGSTWTVKSGLVLAGGVLTVEAGGSLTANCVSSPCSEIKPFWVRQGMVRVTGAGSTLASSSLDLNGNLMVQSGGMAKIDVPSVMNGTITVDGNASQFNTKLLDVFGNGTVTVQNQGLLTAEDITVLGSGATLVTPPQTSGQSGGTISTQFLTIIIGGVLIQNKGVLNMTSYNLIIIGDGVGTPTLTFSDTGALNNATEIKVYNGGTLKITDKDTINLPSAKVSLSNGGTVDVSQGILNIGKASNALIGWVNVGPGGTLTGGQVCEPESLTQSACIPYSLVGGKGTVDGSVNVIPGGTVSIDPETLNITQNFQQTGGTLDLEIDGSQTGEYDQVVAGGSIRITGGTVEFDFKNGFAPSSGDKYALLSAPGGVSISNTTFTTTGLVSGFNYTTGGSSNEFELTATNSGTSTTSPPSSPPVTVTSLDAASGATPLAPGSLASAYGKDLATGQPTIAPFPWPTTVAGTSVTILDLTGFLTQAPVLYASPTLVNYMIPDTVALGPATVAVTAGDGTISYGQIDVVPVGPGLFAVNSAGLSASFADCVTSDGGQATVLTSQVVNGALVAVPLNLKACQETVLELWTTGLDFADPTTVQVTIGGTAATLLYAGPQGVFPGVDQVNVVIPQSLAGAGNVPIVVSAGGVMSNTVNLTIQ